MNKTIQSLAALALIVLLTGCERAESPGEGDQQRAQTEAVETEQAAPATGPAADDCLLSVGWDPWEPYQYLAAGGELQGLDVEIIEALAERANCQLEFVQGSWGGLLRLLRAGELDVMMGATRVPAREEFAIFSDPYRKESFQLYVAAEQADAHRGRTLEQLLADGFRLGTTQGYYYGDEVNATLSMPEFQDQIRAAALGELNFSRLLDLQIDGFLEDPFVAAAIERRRPYAEQIVALDREIGVGPVTFMFSRASVDPAIVERFNSALEELNTAGALKDLIDEYLQ